MQQVPQTLFNKPDANALEVSQNLGNLIRQKIANEGGSIHFCDYMETALYEPGLGYYNNGSVKLGAGGDFVTAPEVSDIFSQCLAQQCHQILLEIEHPVILEAGPGNGTLACGLMTALQSMDCVPERYYLLETSADFRERQQRLVSQQLPGLQDRFVWLERLPQEPLNGVILANEVLDALPVDRIMYRDEQWSELAVCLDNEEFAWCTVPAGEGETLKEELSLIDSTRYDDEYPDGYITEISPRLKPWLYSFAELLERGLLLLIDYGYSRREYYHPQRVDGTLICQFQHKVHNDPFLYPGLQDISASVDFTAVAEAANKAGLQVSGYTTQAHFLINCGLEQLLPTITPDSPVERTKLAREIQTLMMPGQMGEHCKAIALTREQNNNLLGFKQFDQRHRL